MKNIILILASLTIVACKTKQLASATATTTTTTAVSATSAAEAATPTGKTKGKVSHKYRATGCATVVVTKIEEMELTLIPSVKLPEKMDVDGLEIWFDYLQLRMRNPDGCTVGIPAEITNVKPVK